VRKIGKQGRRRQRLVEPPDGLGKTLRVSDLDLLLFIDGLECSALLCGELVRRIRPGELFGETRIEEVVDADEWEWRGARKPSPERFAIERSNQHVRHLTNSLPPSLQDRRRRTRLRCGRRREKDS